MSNVQYIPSVSWEYKFMYEIDTFFLLSKNLKQVKRGIGFFKGYFFPRIFYFFNGG